MSISRKNELIKNPSTRIKLFNEKGRVCVNCGTTEEHLVLHHIVPLARGGNDVSSNIVVLCECCHRKVHDISIEGLKNPNRKRGGRPRTCTMEDEEKYYWEYVNCEIGTKQLKEKLKMKPSSAISDRPRFHDFKHKHGIKSHKNGIDMAYSRGKHPEEGQWIGCIVFEDGTEKQFYYTEPKQEEPVISEPIEEVVEEVVEEVISEPADEDVNGPQKPHYVDLSEEDLKHIDSHFRGWDVVRFEEWMFSHPEVRKVEPKYIIHN